MSGRGGLPQDGDEWRLQLKQLLLSDRPKPPKKPRTVITSAMSSEKRCSLDIELDFQGLMAARKAELEKRRAEDSAQSDSQSLDDSVFQSEQLAEQDASFDALERMCDKTGSDPDSTLFQYLHSDDKDQMLASIKNKSSVHEAEMSALRRMFEDVSTADQLENESPLKSAECTQLEDVEAPSRLWDTTLTGGGGSERTSPVKMVGLMRPSTIIEDNEVDLSGLSSDQSSRASFHTANLKTAQSSCYETAAESSAEAEATLLNVDELFYKAIARAKMPGMSRGEEEELLKDLHLELGSAQPEESKNFTLEDTVIELSSSDESESNISIKKEQEEEDKENEADGSTHFNDTMEEMEYMMKKGMEYMAAAAAQQQKNESMPAPEPEPAQLVKQNTFTLSPAKSVVSSMQTSSQTSSPLRNTNRPLAKTLFPTSTSSSKKLENRHQVKMPPPKTKFFKQPSGIPTRRQNELKEPSSYSNIISPLRTYMHKAGTVPLFSTFKQSTADNNLAFSQLEKESRLYHQPTFSQGADEAQSKGLIGGLPENAPLLPKKAYICSELKHVIDERTPLPMPKVSKIQKYLNSAVAPSVLRNDGRFKLPAAESQIPKRCPNKSLADLSLASGDISLYTLKDAQKF